jgi:hypothetical protein
MKVAIAAKALAAAVLCALAVTLMIVASIDYDPMLARWAILAWTSACTLVVMLTVDVAIQRALAYERVRTDDLLAAERRRTEDLLERIAAHFAEREQGLRSVSSDPPY